jgi:multidrug resistance efflux pump
MHLADLPAPLRPSPRDEAVSGQQELAPVARESASTLSSQQLLLLFRSALGEPQFDRAAALLATELSRSFACERVIVGMTERRFARIRGLSDGADFGRQQALSRLVGSVMDEALDQGASVSHPARPMERPRITLAHAALARQLAGSALFTVPMFSAGRAVGALMFERPQATGFDLRLTQRIEVAAEALGPLLALKLAQEQSLWQRLRSRVDSEVAARSRGRQLALFAGFVTAIAAAAAMLASNWSFQIAAPTRLEGRIQRAVVAPVDGFLKSAQVRAGDEVREGQLLAELSDDDLRLEQRRAETEVARHESTYSEAQAKGERTQLVMADARIAESRAQLALVEQQIVRTRLVAPFDGLVIKGDLAQQLGAPLKRGDLLLTLTPSRDFRVMLEIDERDAASVHAGSRGNLTLSALPERSFALVVERVMPVAQAEGGRNLFEAEARLETGSGPRVEALRPGLQGMAKLQAGERPLYWLMTHRALDWLRLQWWSWWG